MFLQTRHFPVPSGHFYLVSGMENMEVLGYEDQSRLWKLDLLLLPA